MSDSPATASPRPVLAIHGGAGTIRRDGMSAELEAAYRDALAVILADGARRLAAGATAVDVVVEAVRQLEECELFNAGKGAVYTADERHELDASVMDGRDRSAGAVAGVTRVRNPVLAARAVMAHSGHVMLIGPAADAFAFEQGLDRVEPTWFGTPQRLAQLRRARELALGQVLDHDGQAAERAARAASDAEADSGRNVGGGPIDERAKFGTVGAVALDAAGHVAAATSTGGMTNKRPGRVGDSPILGAGCYADDRGVAVSCTGTGEAFMRAAAAHEVDALVRIGGLSLRAACERVVFDELGAVNGQGGLIAVDARGDVWLGFNTEGMYRGHVQAGAAPVVGIYRDR
ncbi:beta-aspartyl-peptidase [Roseateles aquatilis]|uniref:Isoaspartyl peptidase n=1 Tax=Roseateles aquatilis TaxID=431061 RepID=A0A246J840_9BURK|nr:isoaspartyl peptidase/L-asparaginase [Roseateles aquatilis]OWQ88804.1 beta-aspartyl-peptidase [Roseateles aquatilis]